MKIENSFVKDMSQNQTDVNNQSIKQTSKQTNKSKLTQKIQIQKVVVVLRDTIIIEQLNKLAPFIKSCMTRTLIVSYRELEGRNNSYRKTK